MARRMTRDSHVRCRTQEKAEEYRTKALPIVIIVIKEIIEKKKNKEELTKEELEVMFNGYLNGKVKDYQMSALLMAICLNDMTDKETLSLTDIFLNSGERLNLSFIKGLKVDKHSTGGVGDKTTLIIGPIVASCNVPFIKMSGRGLGFTGGTIDKLESIDGFKVNLTEEEIEKQAKDINIVVTSQTKDLTPLDKKVYALRDATSTTESVPLIASSIMSKKIAGGTDKIVIDIKVGEGALLKDKTEAERLGKLLIKIGKNYNREVVTIYSDMNAPLGKAIGNKLEVIEAIKVLKGLEKGKLYDECVFLASNLISLAKNISLNDARTEVIDSINNLKAYQKFCDFITYQHGNIKKLKIEDEDIVIRASRKGTIREIHALEVAKLSYNLGAGRNTKEESIDYDAGVYLEKEIGDEVKPGDVLMRLYTKKKIDNINLDKIFEIV